MSNQIEVYDLTAGYRFECNTEEDAKLFVKAIELVGHEAHVFRHG